MAGNWSCWLSGSARVCCLQPSHWLYQQQQQGQGASAKPQSSCSNICWCPTSVVRSVCGTETETRPLLGNPLLSGFPNRLSSCFLPAPPSDSWNQHISLSVSHKNIQLNVGETHSSALFPMSCDCCVCQRNCRQYLSGRLWCLLVPAIRLIFEMTNEKHMQQRIGRTSICILNNSLNYYFLFI